MNDFFDIANLDLLTEEEKKFNKIYVNKLLDYANPEGKVQGAEIRNLTAGASVIARRQQSRSATALLKYNINQQVVHENQILLEKGKQARKQIK